MKTIIRIDEEGNIIQIREGNIIQDGEMEVSKGDYTNKKYDHENKKFVKIVKPVKEDSQIKKDALKANATMTQKLDYIIELLNG